MTPPDQFFSLPARSVPLGEQWFSVLRDRLAPKRWWSECDTDAECTVASNICVDHECVPRCTDTDGGIVDTVTKVVEQIVTPGATTTYLPAKKNGTTTWAKLQMVDACKTPTLLLEHSCLKKSSIPGTPPIFTYNYFPCPTGTTCAAATDPVTNVTAAACVPDEPPPPPSPPVEVPSCDPLAPMSWQGIGLESSTMPTYVVHDHNGSLFAGGIGGVRCWDPDEGVWQAFNDGFAPPLWMNTPMVVDLVTYNDTLYAVQVNGGADRLHQFVPDVVGWEPVDAPLEARSLLVSAEQFYLGHTAGVHRWDADLGDWKMLGSPIDSTVKTIYRDGATLLAGTFAGDVARFDPVVDTWAVATPPLDANYVHTLQRYGDYLYIGAEWALSRCWTETETWDAGTICEPIESETGFTSDLSPLDLHVHNGILHVATNKGVRRFDAVTDTWLPLNTGLADANEAPFHTFSLTTFAGDLVLGTIEGVYRYTCDQ